MKWIPVRQEDMPRLHSYYAACNYRLCEYSVGVMYMWRHYYHPAFAELSGCLVVRNCVDGQFMFDYPVPGAQGDVDAALREIEAWCAQQGIALRFAVIPREMSVSLLERYPRCRVSNDRRWQDYLYRAEDLIAFAGRRYSGQRNHIRRFYQAYPQAHFEELTPDDDRLPQFWAEYEAEFQKTGQMELSELRMAKAMFSLPENCFRRGGLVSDGRLLAVSLAEKCGDTLIVHIEKALYSCPGVYPAMVQSFAGHFGGDCLWINREDDACDKGLRTSKLQYAPASMGEKLTVEVETELDRLSEIPVIETPRLSLTALGEADKPAYNALCSDDERNRWWGYDYRSDLKGELTEDYFLEVARHDFSVRQAVNWAVRLNGECIGEAVLYAPDFRGGFELGCRIAPAFAGHGYGTEAFAAAADWALYRLGLRKVVAKCYKENTASFKMLSSCMRQSGEDETFYYFTKLV